MDDCCRYVPVLRIFRHARRAPLSSLRGCMQRLAELAYRASYTRYHAEYAVDAQGRLPASSAPPPPQTIEVALTGCASGVGLGLDHTNRVTTLKQGGPAAASGRIQASWG